MVIDCTSSNFHSFLIQKGFLILGGKVFILIYKNHCKNHFRKKWSACKFLSKKNKQVNVGQQFFFSSTVYLSVLLGCGSMDISETSEFCLDPIRIRENAYLLILNARDQKEF